MRLANLAPGLERDSRAAFDTAQPDVINVSRTRATSKCWLLKESSTAVHVTILASLSLSLSFFYQSTSDLALLTMLFPSISIVILFYLASCVDPVITMRSIYPEGWLFPWPGHFKDKRLCLHDSAVVYAWPSTGGRLELQNPSAFELDILGVRDYSTESNRSTDAAEEDAFVQRLRRLGGTFYKYQYGIRHRDDLGREIDTWLGWPEDEEHKGGVWVLKIQKSEALVKMTGRIRLATTMQDRCRAIEMCGGVFYASPTEGHLVPMEPISHPSGMDPQDQDRRQRDALSFQP